MTGFTIRAAMEPSFGICWIGAHRWDDGLGLAKRGKEG